MRLPTKDEREHFRQEEHKASVRKKESWQPLLRVPIRLHLMRDLALPKLSGRPRKTGIRHRRTTRDRLGDIAIVAQGSLIRELFQLWYGGPNDFPKDLVVWLPKTRLHEDPMSDTRSLYDRLGGYDAISAVANNLLPRLMADERLGRFWQHRGSDGIDREKQQLIDFLCHNAGGPMYYTGRDMATSHRGMRISETDWTRFIGHLKDTLIHFDLPDEERNDVLVFVESTKPEIVEA